MACAACGAKRGHLGGCGEEGRGKPALDASLSAREKRALKDENPAGRGTPKARKVKGTVTGRVLKAQKQAAKKANREGR